MAKNERGLWYSANDGGFKQAQEEMHGKKRSANPNLYLSSSPAVGLSRETSTTCICKDPSEGSHAKALSGPYMDNVISQ